MATKSQTPVFLIFFLFIVFGAVMNSFFIVDQTHQAMVLRFGKPVNIITESGLKFKVPFVDAVEQYEKRVVVFNGEEMTAILADKDRLIVDAFVTYRIINPLQFYQTVRSERIMNQRLESIVEKSLRDVLGRETLATLLSPKRESIMKAIRDNVHRFAMGKGVVRTAIEGETEEDILEKQLNADTDASGFGVEVVDVRIMRTDLPKETSQAIYNRMRSDRQKVAEKFRAEGQKESQIIRSEADKTRTILIAEAQKKSEIIRGEGDGEATRIFAQAFGKDPQFFEFYRSMQAYRKSLSKDDTTLIMSPNGEFLKHLGR